MNDSNQTRKLDFFLTPPHPCSYLDDREAVTLFANPRFPVDNGLYTLLTRYGFRRSGNYIYRPHCNECQACVPVRVPAAEFQPSRRQRRIQRRNADLTRETLAPDFDAGHFALYRRYLASRHPGGGMDDPDETSYRAFLTSTWSSTEFNEYRSDGRLVAVSVVDRLDDALSAVYTFFDPDEERRSPGVFAIVDLIAQAAADGLAWVYLGYWIGECRKMAYKTEYQPLEYYVDDRWQRGLPGLP